MRTIIKTKGGRYSFFPFSSLNFCHNAENINRKLDEGLKKVHFSSFSFFLFFLPLAAQFDVCWPRMNRKWWWNENKTEEEGKLDKTTSRSRSLSLKQQHTKNQPPFPTPNKLRARQLAGKAVACVQADWGKMLQPNSTTKEKRKNKEDRKEIKNPSHSSNPHQGAKSCQSTQTRAYKKKPLISQIGMR